MSPDLDVIVVAGVTSPGVCTLSGHKREQNLDVKEADGQKGATTTWKGTKVGKFVATFELAEIPGGVNEIDDAWPVFAEVLRSTVPPKSGAKPVAKDVYHPDLAANDYTSIILDTMGEMVRDTKGGGKIAVTLSEYYPPAPAKAGSANGSKSKGGAGDPNDPIDVANAELKKLLDEGKNL